MNPLFDVNILMSWNVKKCCLYRIKYKPVTEILESVTRFQLIKPDLVAKRNESSGRVEIFIFPLLRAYLFSSLSVFDSKTAYRLSTSAILTHTFHLTLKTHVKVLNKNAGPLEPRFNKVPRDWRKGFSKPRFHYVQSP